ncbi:MAG: hypothetical protein METHP_02117 [Methanoregula sp. SKADARSKE-2]|nr:MAG: hypothetical protein METHP_02117 [Methanoregula sp. SKADARSKE-2]
MLRPGYLVHELAINTPEGMAAALRQQRALIGSAKTR